MHRTKTGKEFWDNIKSEIIQMYENETPTRIIGDKFGCADTTIAYKLKEWGVPIRKKRHNAKYKIDYDFFKIIDTEEKAYWFGFLLADGHVNDRGIMMALQDEDLIVIKDFLKAIKTDYPIRRDSHGNPCINIICKDLADDLLNKGFNHRKSYSLNFQQILSNVPKELENHFVRGMFDGDGSIKYYKYDYQKRPQYHLGYTGLKEVCEYIKEKFEITRDLIQEGNVTYTAITRNPDLINKIREYLYKDATIFMARKYNTFEEIRFLTMKTFNDYNKGIQDYYLDEGIV